MRRTGRTPIESNAAEVHIQPFRPFGPLYTEGIVKKVHTRLCKPGLPLHRGKFTFMDAKHKQKCGQSNGAVASMIKKS